MQETIVKIHIYLCAVAPRPRSASGNQLNRNCGKLEEKIFKKQMLEIFCKKDMANIYWCAVGGDLRSAAGGTRVGPESSAAVGQTPAVSNAPSGQFHL